MQRLRVIAFFCFVFGGVASGVAQAQTDDAILAQHHFDRGVELYDRGDFAGARDSFRASSELIPSPNSTLYIARCHRGLEQLALAVEAYELTLRQIRTSGDETGRYAQTASAAEAELAPLERRIGRLVLTGDLASTATVSVGEREIPVAALGLPIAVEPGESLIRVTDRGRTWDQSARVRARQELSVTLAPPRPATGEDEARVGTIGSASQDEDGSRFGLLHVGAIASAAVAVVGIGLAIGFGTKANDRFTELDAACMGGPCPASLAGAVDEGRGYQTAANVGIAVGVIGAVAAAVFLVMAVWGGDEEGATEVAIDGAGRLRFRGL